MLAHLLLQANAVDAAPGRPAAFGVGCCITPFLMLAATAWVFTKWPQHAGGRILVGGLLAVLPFLGLGLRLIAGESFTVELIGASGGHLLWIGLFVYSVVQIRRAELEEPPKPPPVRKRSALVQEPELPAETRFEGVDPLDLLTNGAPPETPVFARCKKCMGRWRTTLGDVNALEACPKCGDSAPTLIIKQAE